MFRLAWFDAVEMLGSFVGTCLSPHVFNAGGYYALYVGRAILVASALAYWLKFIKSKEEIQQMRRDKFGENNNNEDEKKEEEEVDDRSFYEKYVTSPLKEFYVTLTKKRDKNLRSLLYVNFVVYFIYISTLAYSSEKYMYMSKVFDDFDGDKYALLHVFEQMTAMISLFILLPFFMDMLKWHEVTLELLICISVASGLAFSAFARNIFPEFAVSMCFVAVLSAQWALVRSVFTKMVGENEVGKVFSFVGLLASTLTLVAVPFFKKLYNATLTVFPATFLLYAASAYTLALVLNCVLWTFRDRFNGEKKEEKEKEEKA